MSFILYMIYAVSILQCGQFGDFVAKCSYFLIVAATFIDF